MGCRNRFLAGIRVAAMAAAALSAASAYGQVRCNASQSAAVECFVSNALATRLTTLRYGMNTSQFESYGVAVSKILQNQQASLFTLGMASAVADAMPATNANNSPNEAAQQTAISAIVSAEITYGLIPIPNSVTEQQLIWFSYDMVSGMDENTGITISPGALLRVVDSYIVTATSAGTVNWTKCDASLSTMVSNLESSGLLKLPSNVTLSKAQAFTQSIALAIYNYKLATGRATL